MVFIGKKAVSSGRKGEGSIFKRGQLYYLEFRVHGKRKKVSLKTTRRDEAVAKARSLLSPADARTAEEVALHIARARRMRFAKDVDLGDAFALFAEGCATLRESTLKDYSYKWGTFLEWLSQEYPSLTRVSELDQQVANCYGAHLENTGMAPRTFNAHRNALSLITRRVFLRIGSPDTDPWRFVRTKSLDTLSKHELTSTQVTKMLARLADPDYGLPFRKEWEVVFHLGAFAGLRLADAVRLEWSSVDLAARQLSLIPVKTARTHRRVHLPIHPLLFEKIQGAWAWRDSTAFVCPTLAAQYQRQPCQVRRNAMRVFRDCELVTVDAPMPRDRRIRQCVIGFHSLRHSFVSFCANAGVPLAVVQALVGHGSPAMTRHYAHISVESAQKAIMALPLGQDAEEPEPSLLERVEQAVKLLHGRPSLTDVESRVLSLLTGASQPVSDGRTAVSHENSVRGPSVPGPTDGR